DQAIADISGGRNAAPLALVAGPSVASAERWALTTAARTRDNQDETHYLVVPLRFAKWYLSEMKDPENTPKTDLPVSDYISKIQFFDNIDTLIHEVYPFWQWYQFKDDLPADATPQNVRRAEMAFLQTS